MSEGADAIRKYFSVLKGSGYKSAVGERRTIVLGDSAVVVTGFYELGILDGKSRPSRFTMLIVKRDGIWNIERIFF